MIKWCFLFLSLYVESWLASPAYSFQTFSLNQVLTAAQMNQVEVNIRDHQHGVAGVSALAGTQAQMEAATDATAYANAANMQWFPSVAKAIAKVTVAAGTPTLQTPPAYNITSITDTATGRLTITIATDFSSAQWCCVPGIEVNQGASSDTFSVSIDNASQAAGSVILECWQNVPSGPSVTLADPVAWHMIGMGDQA